MSESPSPELAATIEAVADRIQGTYTLASTDDQCMLIKRLVERLDPCPPIHILTRAQVPADTDALLGCLENGGVSGCSAVTIHLLDPQARGDVGQVLRARFEGWDVRVSERELPVRSDHLIVIGSSFVVNDFSEEGIQDLRRRVDEVLASKGIRTQRGEVGSTPREAAAAVYVEKQEVHNRVLELIA